MNHNFTTDSFIHTLYIVEEKKNNEDSFFFSF